MTIEPVPVDSRSIDVIFGSIDVIFGSIGAICRLFSRNAVIINTTQIYRNRKYRRKGKENEKNKIFRKGA